MYIKTIGPADAKIMLVGEAPGKEEDRTHDEYNLHLTAILVQKGTGLKWPGYKYSRTV